MRTATDEQLAYRSAIGRFASGVTVVTTAGPDGYAGLTTSAVCSLSLDPLLLLVCFDNASRTLPVVRDVGRFAVNVLREDGEVWSRVFASKKPLEEKFAGVTYSVDHGVPVLDDALAWFVCDVEELVARGDHTIGVGRVAAFAHDDEARPLIFYNSAYERLGAPAAS